MKSNNNISNKQIKSLHYVYIVLCLLTGEFYFGKHSTNNKNDGYSGSGSELNKRKKEIGNEHFIITPFALFQSEEEAYDIEEDLIRHFISDIKCLNKVINSRGSKCDHGVYMFSNGKKVRLHIKDPNVLSGLAIGVMKGKKNPKVSESKKGKRAWNRDLKTGPNAKLKNINKGTTTYKILSTGEIKKLHKDDLLVKLGKAVGVNKGKPNASKGKKRGPSWNAGKKTGPNVKIQIQYTKEESDFINKLHCLGKSPFQIRKPFNEKFNKNISRDAIKGFLKRK